MHACVWKTISFTQCILYILRGLCGQGLGRVNNYHVLPSAYLFPSMYSSQPENVLKLPAPIYSPVFIPVHRLCMFSCGKKGEL